VTVRVRSDRVLLRPFREHEFQRVWEEMEDSGEHQPMVSRDDGERERVFERLRLAGNWTPEELRLAVEGDGELVGDLQARVSNWALPPGVTELGITLFVRARGKGYGTEALRLVCGHLLADPRFHRVQLSTDVRNAAMRRAAEKAGFTFEGVLRGFWEVPGGPALDYAIYGRIRADEGSRR
jgi:RimJ/RimL family protein N-acetyltransferase